MHGTAIFDRNGVCLCGDDNIHGLVFGREDVMRTFVIAILFVACLSAQGQSVGYFSFSPEDNAIGIRADMNHTYLSMSYGNYKLPYGAYIRDHSKIGVGFIYDKFSLGLAYHSFGKVNEVQKLNKATFRPISVEAGVRVFVNDWLVSAFRYDILRHEGTVEFGIKFISICY